MKRSSLERLAGIILLVAVLTAFGQVAGHDFINFDDGPYITLNDHVQAGLTWSSIRWAFTTMHSANWHPLTWLSHMLDYQLYGLRAGGHHLINLFLHVANTLLLFLCLREATGSLGRSFMVAGLFALHPLHVESVAWVAERKDCLSAFFWMLTLLFYIRYSERPGCSRYLLTFASFALGLMAKPMLVTLPFVLLLMDFWPLGRLKLSNHLGYKEIARSLKPLVREKIPLFLLSAASGVVTYIAQSKMGAVSSFAAIPLKMRVINGLWAYVRYLEKTFWPHDLAVFYPYPGSSLAMWKGMVAGLFLAAVLVLVLRQARRWPFLPVGWLWFLGTLVPVIGIIQVGGQSMADRYTYIPSIGIFIMAAWAIPDLLARARIPYHRSLLAFLSAGILLSLSVATWLQVGYWKNTRTIFQHAASVTESNYLAHCMMGEVLAEEGKPEGGIAECKKALSIWPAYPDGHSNLGDILARKGLFKEAIVHYEEALKTDPRHPGAHINMGKALVKLGKKGEAASHYSAAERFIDDNSWAHNWLGVVWVEMDRFEEARRHFLQALKLGPNRPETHNNMGRALMMQGRVEEAISHLEKAVKIRPDFPEALNNLGLALVQEGRLEEAIYSFSAALHWRPGYEKARTNLYLTVQRMCVTTQKLGVRSSGVRSENEKAFLERK